MASTAPYVSLGLQLGPSFHLTHPSTWRAVNQLTMEPRNDGLEDASPFQSGDFQVPCGFSGEQAPFMSHEWPFGRGSNHRSWGLTISIVADYLLTRPGSVFLLTFEPKPPPYFWGNVNYQVIQVVTFLSPIVGGHLAFEKGHFFTIPKRSLSFAELPSTPWRRSSRKVHQNTNWFTIHLQSSVPF